MKFSTREDIAAPIDSVFAAVSDFEMHERAMLRRGAQVRRIDDQAAPGQGTRWHSRFPFRGKQREMTAEVVCFEAPEAMQIRSTSTGLDGLLSLELVELSPRRTRLAVELEIKPRTLSSRLFLQSLKLAKSSLTKRYKSGIRRFARELEQRIHGRA